MQLKYSDATQVAAFLYVPFSSMEAACHTSIVFRLSFVSCCCCCTQNLFEQRLYSLYNICMTYWILKCLIFCTIWSFDGGSSEIWGYALIERDRAELLLSTSSNLCPNEGLRIWKNKKQIFFNIGGTYNLKSSLSQAVVTTLCYLQSFYFLLTLKSASM